MQEEEIAWMCLFKLDTSIYSFYFGIDSFHLYMYLYLRCGPMDART